MNFNQTLIKNKTILNHEGAQAYPMTPEMELYTAVVTTPLEDMTYEDGSNRAKRIESLATKVDPQFLAKLAVYARTKMNLRSIPLVLLVLLAKTHNGDRLVANAVKETVLRADEIAELLMCWQCFNPVPGRKKLGKLPKGIQNGLKESFNRFDEYQFAKYNRKDKQVTLKDALFIVHPKAKDAAQQAIFDKIASGTLETPYTWETELSALGQQVFETPEAKKLAFRAKWEELIASRKLGYMALLRNLRNILDAGVGGESIKAVCSILADPFQVRRSKQLPFRFLSAFNEISRIDSPYTAAIMTALEKAAEASAENISGFDFDTRVLNACDVSGSMQHPISQNSTVQLYDIGLMLAMLLQNRCKCVMSGMFGDIWKVVGLPGTAILSNVRELRRREGEVGYSTNGHLVVDYLIENKIKMDKVMLFTDCQMWDSRHGNETLQASWKKYRRMFPEAKLYLFDLAGYGQSPVELRKDGVALIAGWSDRVFEILEALEKGSDAIAEIMKIEL